MSVYLHFWYSFVDWIEHIWNNKSWYNKIFYNSTKKLLAITWLFGNYKNNAIFKNQQCNYVCILESSIFVTHNYNILYNRVSNNLHQGNDADSIANNDHNRWRNTNCIPPPSGWYKWKADASRDDYWYYIQYSIGKNYQNNREAD